MISPLDSWLSILNPAYGYTFVLITLLVVHHQMLDHYDLHFHVQAPSLCDHVATTLCHFVSSSFVLLCLTQITLT